MVEAAASGGRYGMVWWYWYQQAPLFTALFATVQYTTHFIFAGKPVSPRREVVVGLYSTTLTEAYTTSLKVSVKF